jgi:hypothetical protein
LWVRLPPSALEAPGYIHAGRTPARHLVSTSLPIAALAVALVGSPSAGNAAPTETPLVVSASPHADPSDRPGDGFLRVTFSPDGDGRRDQVTITVRSARSDRLVLEVHPASNAKGFQGPARTVGPGTTRLEWDGLAVDGKPRAGGSYVIRICSATTGECGATRVLAHLRILSVFTPRGSEAVSPGETIPVAVASDRLGPYTLDLAPVTDPRGAGVGAQVVAGPGQSGFRVPPVAGGFWLLRLRSGTAVTYYPLVVHDPLLALDHPPHGTALVVHPYITWRAYDRTDENRDGEVDSWYSHPYRPVVPLTGPFERIRREPVLAGRETSPGSEQAFARWAQKHALTAQHVTDIELGRMPLAVLRRYAVIVFPGHTEYYERQTYGRLLAYRKGGGRLYFLQGNSFYGEVSVGTSRIVRLSYRYRTPKQSDFRLAATGFRSCCWPSTISPRYHLATGVRERLPWLFEGTVLKAGDELGLALREVDTTDSRLSPQGTIRVASAIVPPFASPGSGEDAALGWNGTRPFRYERASVRARRIDIAYAATSRGEVFSWGNCGFMQSLNLETLPAIERVALDRMAFNVWQHFTR